MGDLFAVAVFVSSFLKLDQSSFDLRKSGHTLVAVLSYVYVLLNRGFFGGFWLLDALLFGVATWFLVRAHQDADGRCPRMVLALPISLAIVCAFIALAPKGGRNSGGGRVGAAGARIAERAVAPALVTEGDPKASPAPTSAAAKELKGLLDKLQSAEPQQELHGAADGRGLDLLLEKHADQRLREVIKDGNLGQNVEEIQKVLQQE